MRRYDVTIWGRKNTIITDIRDKMLKTKIVVAQNQKEAVDMVLMYVLDDSYITRRDVRVEVFRIA